MGNNGHNGRSNSNGHGNGSNGRQVLGPDGKPAAIKVTVNSFGDLERKDREHHQSNSNYVDRYEAFQAAVGLTRQMNGSRLTANIGAADLIRSSFLRFLLDGPRDIDAECGYPAWLTPDHYRVMYDREGIAKRVVDCEPEESWALDPEVYDDDDPKVETDFEKVLKDLLIQHNLWHYLMRADILSGIGQYGILLIGINDGKDLKDPVDGFHDDGTIDKGLSYRLNYLRPFSEDVIFVKTRETDVTNPRYGLPTRYTIQFRDFPNWGIQAGEIIARDIHWSRVIHLADNRKMSEVYGVPRMMPVYNRLYDLRKVYAASGEAFWKGAFPGIAFEVNPELADQGVGIDGDAIRKEMEKYMDGTQRYLAVTGVTTKTIPPVVQDPTPTVEVHLKAIAICKAIPERVLFGSEEAKLASGQDAVAWNKRLARRQTKYLTPMVLRPFIDRLVAFGVLPAPESANYQVEWPDLNSPSDSDKAEVALQRTQALQAYVQGGVEQIVPLDHFLTDIMLMSQEQKDAIVEKANGQQMEEQSDGTDGTDGSDQQLTDEQQEQYGQQESELDQGVMGGEAVPSQGNALAQDNLSRSTTAPPGAEEADPTFVSMPELNSSKQTINHLLNEFVLSHADGDFIINEGHQFSCVMAPLPDSIASKVLAMTTSIPDSDLAEEGRELKPHVTALYGIHTIDKDEVEDAIDHINPFPIKLGKLGIFSNDEHDVLFIKVTSPQLRRLNNDLKTVLDYTNDKEFKPHVTLAYLKPGMGKKYAGADDFAGTKATIDHLTFSTSDDVSHSLSLNWDESQHPRDQHGRFGQGDTFIEDETAKQEDGAGSSPNNAVDLVLPDSKGNVKTRAELKGLKDKIAPTETEMDAVKSWATDEGCQAMRQAEKGHEFDANDSMGQQAKGNVDTLAKLYDRLPEYEGTTYRAIGMRDKAELEHLQHATGYELSATSSFTKNSSSANSFVSRYSNKNPVLLKMTGKPKLLTPLSPFGESEGETLFKKGTRFKIDRSYWAKKTIKGPGTVAKVLVLEGHQE